QQKKLPTPDRALNKTLPTTHESIQPWIRDLAKQADSRSSFNELMDTHVNLAFLINRLKVDTLTPELLDGPTYKLMKGSCKSLMELEFFLEEVYKATTDQLDWNNPEGQQYPHNLLKPLPLIPNSQGRRVILFDHFMNNDLEYLRGGASSHKYTTSVTKTKAADYGHIKWIEDLVPRTIDNDKLYKFKEGDFKRLRIQDIEDMLLILVQGKLTNLTVEERFAFNVSLRMFTRSIVIQRLMEDLQLGVESYQKKLNLTKPDTYRFDLKRKEAYTAYSNPRGFIYQNKDKQNRLKERDAEIANLNAQLSLKEAEAAEVIHLCGKLLEAIKVNEMKSLKERNVALKGRVAAFESLSYDELNVKASSLEFKKDKLVYQVFVLETTYFGLRDEVMGYKLFKEMVEEMQDEQVKALSNRVASIDYDLMEMALYIEEEFYPRYLTTIAGWRRILKRGLKHVIMKCLQSPNYLAVLGGAIGRAIDKGMQDELPGGIDHGKAERSLVDVFAHNPSVKANYFDAITTLCVMDFLLLAQLESKKDASIADIMYHLRLEGPAAEAPKASQLQPSTEQLMVLIHRLEDHVVIWETSLVFSLDVAHTHIHRNRGDVVAHRLSFTNVMVLLIEPLSVKIQTGETSSSRVPATATTTALSTTLAQASTIPLYNTPCFRVIYDANKLTIYF
nr:hypothetical protein [Tanacetum cinerariifolium]